MKVDKQKVFSVLLMVLGFMMLLVVLYACMQPKPVVIKAPEDRAVTLEIRCLALGTIRTTSAVLTGRDEVLTAAHAVRCEGPAVVITGTRHEYPAVKVEVDDDNDFAIFKAKGISVPVVFFAEAQWDEVLCVHTAHPKRERKCGTVTMRGSEGPGSIIHTLNPTAQNGNVGAGVFNEFGHLVGVLSMSCRLGTCNKVGTNNIMQSDILKDRI